MSFARLPSPISSILIAFKFSEKITQKTLKLFELSSINTA